MAAYGSDQSTIQLLAQIQAGEPTSWSRLVDRYGPLVRFWCRQANVPEADLDDLSQEVWLALGPTMARYRPDDGGKFRGWLRSITIHKALEWQRRRRGQLAEAEGGSVAVQVLHQVKAVEDDETSTTIAARRKSVDRRVFQLIRNEFEDRTWRAFLGAVAGRATADVAAELGMSPSAVRMARSRVLNRFRQELGKQVD